MSRPGASAGGFTLVEVLIAMVLMGIMMAIALPPLRSSQEWRVVHSAADEFAARHSMARAAAVRRGRLAELHIDAGTGRLWVEVDTSAARAGVMDTLGPVLDVADQFGVTVTSTRSRFCFDVRGLATQTSGCPPGDATVVFSRGSYADTVRTSVVGKVLR
ncbi:MAG: Tfp pilus assembly protein FimT/FimU [Gemmatimonadota bacterium]